MNSIISIFLLVMSIICYTVFSKLNETFNENSNTGTIFSITLALSAYVMICCILVVIYKLFNILGIL
jgi:hypothetical protein